MMAYVGARVVYTLGSEISRARELGSYRLVERLGQGGMGEVWRAKHRLLARPAAIKLIRPSLTADGRIAAFEDTRRRFEREAQVIASLRSPHTVTLFDFGVSADGAFDRARGVHSRHADRAAAPSCADPSDTAVGKDGSAHPFGS